MELEKCYLWTSLFMSALLPMAILVETGSDGSFSWEKTDKIEVFKSSYWKYFKILLNKLNYLEEQMVFAHFFLVQAKNMLNRGLDKQELLRIVDPVQMKNQLIKNLF